MSAAAPRLVRRQQDRRTEAEERLLQAAARMIGAHGTSGATLALIGKEAGYSRGLITHHFGSKLGLVQRLAGAVQERFIAGATLAIEGRSGLEAVVRVTELYVEEMTSPDDAQRAFLVLWSEAASTAPELREVVVERDRAARTPLAERVLAGQQDGSIRADVDAGAFAALHLNSMRAIAIAHMLDPDDSALRAVVAELIAQVRARLAA